MKKLLSIVLSGVLCGSLLTGCGGTSSGSKDTDKADVESTAKSGTEAAGKDTGSDKAVEIEMLVHKVEITDILNSMADMFHEEYPI